MNRFTRITAILVVFLASVVPAHVSAGGPFLEWGKGAAGVVIIGGVACALTGAILPSNIALCTPTQLRQHQAGRSVPFVPEQHANLLTPQQQLVYLGRIYVPAGQQPGGNVSPPATPPATPPAVSPQDRITHTFTPARVYASVEEWQADHGVPPEQRGCKTPGTVSRETAASIAARQNLPANAPINQAWECVPKT